MKHVIKIMMLFLIAFHKQTIFAENPAQVAAVKKALQNGVQVINCANCDLRGTQDLAGLRLSGAHLPGIALQPCIPNDTNKNSLMICIPGQAADLTGINLSRATLFSSCFDGASLDKADLSNADMSNCSARFMSMKDAKVTGLVTTNSTFCNSVMPDGNVCLDTWVGQGIAVACNCSDQDKLLVNPTAATSSARKP